MFIFFFKTLTSSKFRIQNSALLSTHIARGNDS